MYSFELSDETWTSFQRIQHGPILCNKMATKQDFSCGLIHFLGQVKFLRKHCITLKFKNHTLCTTSVTNL